jgi:post-segregation antitoxin (ccd killing protein)
MQQERAMANLTIRMDPAEKRKLSAWAEAKGKTLTDYLKDLVAEDMARETPETRAKAWLVENRDAIAAEARRIEERGIPGADLAIHHPRFDDEV